MNLGKLPVMGRDASRYYEDENIKIDHSTQSVWVRGRLAEMSVREYQLLSLLVANQHKTLSSDDLVEQLWERDYLREIAAYYMSRLRSIIELEVNSPRIIRARYTGWVYVPSDS